MAAGELLLINPSPRRRARKSTKRRARRAVAAAPRRVRRRRNPIAAARRRVFGRPARRMSRRRRNPIGMGSSRAWMQSAMDALIGAAGAVAADVGMGQLNKFLPASMASTPGVVNAGTAVKAVATVAAGFLLDKVTKGYSRKAAVGALTVQLADIAKGYVPASLPLGYSNPARVINRNARIGPNMMPRRVGLTSMNAYMAPGTTPMLNGVGAYQRPGGGTALLNSARGREGQMR